MSGPGVRLVLVSVFASALLGATPSDYRERHTDAADVAVRFVGRTRDTVTLRVSVTPRGLPAHQGTVTVAFWDTSEGRGTWPSPPGFSNDAPGDSYDAIRTFHSASKRGPIVRVTLFLDAGRNGVHYQTFLRYGEKKLELLPLFAIQMTRPDESRRVSGPVRFTEMEKLLAWNDTTEMSGATSQDWHHILLRVNSSRGEETLDASVPVQIYGIASANSTPDPRITPLPAPTMRDTYCLWRANPPDGTFTYAPCK
ncbi:MAG: hypothetical protein NVSMB31_10250 [Vulcanimicrobiaceae bacterium]